MPRSSLSRTVHRSLALVSRTLPSPDRVVAAFHEVPSVDALGRTLDVLAQTVGPFRTVDEITAGADGVALTFDDGDRSIIDVAAPFLARERIPATTYVVGGLIGTDDPFWWYEVERRVPDRSAAVVSALKELPESARIAALEGLRADTPDVTVRMANLQPDELVTLERSGITVGNHSTTHPLLDRCSDDAVERELTTTHDLLHGWLGHEPSSIAYPNGNVDERVLEVARRLGYGTGLLFDHRPVSVVRDPLLVSRIKIDVGSSPDVVRARASGLHPRLHHAIGRS